MPPSRRCFRSDGAFRPAHPDTPHRPAGSPAPIPLGSRGAPVAERYDRQLMLPRLLPLMPREIADLSVAGRWHVVRLLVRALRRERRDGAAGRWTYDPNRHLGLRQALDAERRALATTRCGGLPPAPRRDGPGSLPPAPDR
ncbi:hypothetical protein SAMN02745172_02865 [Pseudoxanthobacter soli DSM 19599]|uniref:Uncharacterized protein n=1 Tax=Pseudoxanthobacter soli DSM 19599 TaxID=1123029 RepID=A0A1M7ZMT5_9HYPH|nr:hypothetical protein [Pseudoxanthobacter soli]SHO66210.1 hypothetical protein SAMN02745172_02865 [Pseudoxanthobacter soli DSM 19599]